MKRDLHILIFISCLLSFITIGYAAFNSTLSISGEGTVIKDTVAPTCGAWKLRKSTETYQEAYDNNSFINPSTNTTWREEDLILSIECSDNMGDKYGCIDVNSITDSTNKKVYYKDVKNYTTSIKTDSNEITVVLEDAYNNQKTCTLPAGGSNPYIDKTVPSCSMTLTGDTIGNNGYYLSDATLTTTSSKAGPSGISLGVSTSSTSKTTTKNAENNKTASISTVRNTNTSGTTYYGYVKTGSGKEATCSKIVKVEKSIEAPEYISGSSTENGIIANYTAGVAVSGIDTITCEVGPTLSYGLGGMTSGNNCVFASLNPNTEYYYQKCITTNAGNNACTPKSILTAGRETSYNYRGGQDEYITSCSGTYKLETWGAKGGNGLNTSGGYGGYSRGYVDLNNGNLLYINVGGAGTSSETSSLTAGGYNGGGNSWYGGGSGGGATHIALNSGQLSTLANQKGTLSSTNDYYISNNILIVAGGGGGGGYLANTDGGHAGGYLGNAGVDYSEAYPGGGKGGTQVSGGALSSDPATGNKSPGTVGTFGLGGNAGKELFQSVNYGAGAGGGGFFGGSGANSRNGGGGGGSGYIGNPLLTNKSMYCYNCSTSTTLNTKTVSTTCTSSTPTENCSKQGNGYAKITSTTCTNDNTNNYKVTYDSGNLIYGLNNTTSSVANDYINYTIKNGVVTVTSARSTGDAYGYTSGRVYLEAGKTYTFDCDINGVWGIGYDDTVEAFLMLDGTTSYYIHMNNNDGYKFTPTQTGTYYLRLDVNYPGTKIYTFSNIRIRELVTVTKTEGDKLGTLPVPTLIPGTELDGWYTEPTNGTKVTSDTVVPPHDVIYYAQASKPKYTLTFDPDGGYVNETSREVEYGKTYYDLPTPTKEGYTFAGWYADLTGANDYVNFGRGYMYEDKLSVHLSVYMDDWSTFNSRIISCTEGGGFNIQPSDDADKKFVFSIYDKGIGYATAPGNISVSSLAPGWHDFDMVYNGVRLTAYIDGTVASLSSTLTSGLIGYNSTNSIFVGAEAGTSPDEPVTPNFNGYIGNVVIRNNDTVFSSTNYNAFTVPHQDLTLHAIWRQDTYTVKYNSNGGNGSMADQKILYNKATALNPNTFTRTGYVFNYWSTVSEPKVVLWDETERSGSSPSTSANYNDFAGWDIAAPFSPGDVYQLDFDAKGSGTLYSYFYGYTDFLQVSKVENSSGYVSTNGGGENPLTLTSDYKHYSVKFTLGSVGTTTVTKVLLLRVLPGSSATTKNIQLTKVTKNVLTDTADRYSGILSSSDSTKDFASWEIPGPFKAGDIYQLEFDAWGAGNLQTYFWGYDNYLGVEKVENSEGYVGTRADGMNVVTIGAMKHYTVTFKLGSNGDGSVKKLLLFRAIAPCELGIKNVSLNKTSKNPMIFSNNATVKNIVPAGDTIDLHAIWEPKYITVNFDQQGGSGGTTSTVIAYGTKKGNYSVVKPTRSNHTFKGYYTGKNGSGTLYYDANGASVRDWDIETSPVTLYADWLPTTLTYNCYGAERVYDVTKTGFYKVEAWGANGGNSYNNLGIGGQGGYSSAEVLLTAGEKLYINVGCAGGNGTSSTGGAGGYNGGGNGAAVNRPSGGGGGATSISYTSGILSSLASKKNQILMVAGGGGGGASESDSSSFAGGYGGGTSGGGGIGFQDNIAPGGTQTTGYAFGQGQNGRNGNDRGGWNYGNSATGGGGGGLYGGKASQADVWGAGSGGGGSGYIMTNAQKITNTSMMNGNQSVPSKANTGGSARITYIRSIDEVDLISSNYGCTGSIEEFVAPRAGNYRLQVWGAQGGSTNSGYGGYSVGEINLTKGTKLYVAVGCAGSFASSTDYVNADRPVTVAGGYNGGGSARVTGSRCSQTTGSGGGATHIGLSNALLKDYSSQVGNLIIAAGGGGGSASYGCNDTNFATTYGGAGGGYVGASSVQIDCSGWQGCGMSTGGSQSAGGSAGVHNESAAGLVGLSGTFGQGANTNTTLFGGAGGGGLYGGGSGNRIGGGGGSGYIGYSSLTNKSMYCYNCSASTAAATKTVSTTCSGANALDNCTKAGDGYAKITYLGSLDTAADSTQTLIIKNYKCEEDGTSCKLASTIISDKATGSSETVTPTAISGYETPPAKAVTYDKMHLLEFYYTKNATYSSDNLNHTTSGFDKVYSNSGNTKMTIKSTLANANYLAIWPSDVGNTKYLTNNVVDNFDYSIFTITGYTARSNGKYGTYYVQASSAQNTTSTLGSVTEIRPYIQIKYDLAGGTGTSTTQTKEANSTQTLHSAPTKSGYTFKAWQAYGESKNSTGIAEYSYQACTLSGAYKYYLAGATLQKQDWNEGNTSYPCPEIETYVDNILTVKLKALWHKPAWNSYK